MLIKIRRQNGFAAVEFVLLVIAIAAISGVGYWVYAQRHNTANNAASLAASSQLPASKAGTTDGIDQLMQEDGQSEAAINSKYEQNEQSQASATDKSLNDLGGAYNETSF